MKAKGFEYCKNSLPFTMYINEKYYMGMDEYIKTLMGSEYEEYRKLVNPDKG